MIRFGDLAISPETVWVGNTMFPTRNIAGVQAGRVVVSTERKGLVGLYIVVGFFAFIFGCASFAAAQKRDPNNGHTDANDPAVIAVWVSLFAMTAITLVLAIYEARQKRTDYALIITANSGQQAQANFTNQAALDKATNTLMYVFHQAGHDITFNTLVVNEAERRRTVISHDSTNATR